MSEQGSGGLWAWGSDATEPRLLHTMLRVGDLERSIEFYCRLLGMRLLERYDFEEARFSIVFISFSDDFHSGAIELTHNWDQQGYDVGNGYGHVAIGVPDIQTLCRELIEAGVEFRTEPKQQIEGGPLLAILKDPDGYEIELIQTRRTSSHK